MDNLYAFSVLLTISQSDKNDGKNQGIAYDYGTNNNDSVVANVETEEEESQLLKDILFCRYSEG